MIWYLEVTPAVGALGCVCGNFNQKAMRSGIATSQIGNETPCHIAANAMLHQEHGVSNQLNQLKYRSTNIHQITNKNKFHASLLDFSAPSSQFWGSPKTGQPKLSSRLGNLFDPFMYMNNNARILYGKSSPSRRVTSAMPTKGVGASTGASLPPATCTPAFIRVRQT